MTAPPCFELSSRSSQRYVGLKATTIKEGNWQTSAAYQANDVQFIVTKVKNRKAMRNIKVKIVTSIYLNTLNVNKCVRRGVLQGDCLSSLLFNMCFNTFIQFIRQEKYKQLGFFAYDKLDCLFNPVHWFQFADYQLLLNFFTKWCQ